MKTYNFRAWYIYSGKVAKRNVNSGEMLQESFPGEVFRWKNEGQQLEIMQYTGLKDKNGVEIYEGDILICESNEYHSVIFESYFACFNTKHLNSGVVSDITRDEMAECFSIAGNIYENPDLLEGKL